jgi:hypothetical protein
MKTISGATRISLSNERTIPMATNTPLKPTIGLKDWIENVRKLAPEARIPYIGSGGNPVANSLIVLLRTMLSVSSYYRLPG